MPESEIFFFCKIWGYFYYITSGKIPTKLLMMKSHIGEWKSHTGECFTLNNSVTSGSYFCNYVNIETQTLDF